jgi:undecaprenyl-diphosphatase
MSDTYNKPVINPEKAIASQPVRHYRLLAFRYGVFLLVVAFTVLASFAKFYPYFPFDLVITRRIQSLSFPFFTEFMQAVSLLGNELPGIGIVCFFVVLALLMKRRKDALFIAVSSLGASLIGMGLKLLVGRPRPAEELLLNFPGYLKDNSFPSGHVLYFMGLYSFLLFLTHSQLKKSRLRTFLMALFTALLVLIGISRIYLGAHWFSDTLGSYLIGSIWLYVLIHFYKTVK